MKKRNTLFSVTLAAATTVLLPVTAFAHVGHGTSGARAGLLHPLTGIDHLLAMVAVGVWAAQLGGRQVWRLPLTFVTCMFCAGLLARAPLPGHVVEIGIALSVLVLGAFVALSFRAPVALASIVAGTFAICHGFAHGAEMRTEYSPLSYGFGFLIATASLDGIGVLVCIALRRADPGMRLVRFAGGCVVACGAILLGGVL